MLSLRYLRARRKEGFISVIAGFSFVGIMLGVATLIIVMAVMNGFRKELLGKILGVQGHMVLQPIDTPLTDYAEAAARLARVPGVRLAAPVIEGQALASSPFNAGGSIVRGMFAADLKRLPLISANIKQGGLDDFDTTEGVMVGQRLANQLSLRIGDMLTLLTPRGNVTALGTTPRIKAYPIVAIFEVGMTEYDSAFVFMPFREARASSTARGCLLDRGLYRQRRPHRPLPACGVGIGRAAGVHRRLAAAKRDLLLGAPGRAQRHVHDPDADRLRGGADHHLGLIMLVKDKGRDIAILRTMGRRVAR